MENIEYICSIPGVVQLGPSDYSMSMGVNLAGHVPEAKAAERRMIEVGLKHGVQPQPGVILLNNSRDPLVVEQDLTYALQSGKVYAAGLDVVSVEPIRADNPLLNAPNCLITPHISWAPKESRKRLMDIAVNNLAAFLKGEPVNVVNS